MSRQHNWLLIIGAASVLAGTLLWSLPGSVGNRPQEPRRWGPGMMMGSGRTAGMGGMHDWMMGGSRGDQAPQDDIPPGAPVTEQRISVREWAIDPQTLTIRAGTHLKLTVRNDGTITHDFDVPALGVKLAGIAPGTIRQIDLYVRESGTYAYLCGLPGHAQAGQKGELIVR